LEKRNLKKLFVCSQHVDEKKMKKKRYERKQAKHYNSFENQRGCTPKVQQHALTSPSNFYSLLEKKTIKQGCTCFRKMQIYWKIAEGNSKFF